MQITDGLVQAHGARSPHGREFSKERVDFIWIEAGPLVHHVGNARRRGRPVLRISGWARGRSLIGEGGKFFKGPEAEVILVAGEVGRLGVGHNGEADRTRVTVCRGIRVGR